MYWSFGILTAAANCINLYKKLISIKRIYLL